MPFFNTMGKKGIILFFVYNGTEISRFMLNYKNEVSTESGFGIQKSNSKDRSRTFLQKIYHVHLGSDLIYSAYITK